jgi:hypothetical protein
VFVTESILLPALMSEVCKELVALTPFYKNINYCMWNKEYLSALYTISNDGNSYNNTDIYDNVYDNKSNINIEQFCH